MNRNVTSLSKITAQLISLAVVLLLFAVVTVLRNFVVSFLSLILKGDVNLMKCFAAAVGRKRGKPGKYFVSRNAENARFEVSATAASYRNTAQRP
jgi:hypothetical protein